MESYEVQFESSDNDSENPNSQRLQTEYTENEEPDDRPIRFEMTKWLEILIVLLFTMLAVLVYEQLGFDLFYILLPSIFLDLKIIVFALIEARKREKENLSSSEFNREQAKDLLESLGTLIFKLILMCHLIKPDFYITFGVFPVFITLLICIFIKKQTLHECQVFSLMILFMMRWLRAFSFLFIALKTDGLVSWNWDVIFWPIWVGVCFLLLLSLGVLLLFMGSVFSYWTRESSIDELLSTAWLFYASLGGSFTFGLFFFTLIGKVHLSISGAAGLTAIYLFALVCATVVMQKKLYLWWDSFFLSETDNFSEFPSFELNDSNHLPLPPSQRLERRNPSFSAQLVAALKKPPKALVRLSSTYFQPADVSAIFKEHRRAFSAKCEIESVENAHRRHFSTSLENKTFQLVKKNREYILKSMSDINFKEKVCEMCCEAECNAVIMECGHGGICYDCSLELWKREGVCHMCREVISEVLEVDPKETSVVKVLSTTRALANTSDN